ncbi:hypothetical protein [Sinobaca sp. H24]|nr:hypothetical protein [Sinobaca sp. H24]
MDVTYQHYINGEWVPSDHDDTIDVINPATEEVISTIPSAQKRKRKKQ